MLVFYFQGLLIFQTMLEEVPLLQQIVLTVLVFDYPKLEVKAAPVSFGVVSFTIDIFCTALLDASVII